MRQIKIPPPVVVKGATVAYVDFIRHLLDTDDRFTRTGAGIRMAMRIERALTQDPPRHHVEEMDWEILRQVAETPTGGYPELMETTAAGVLVRRMQTGRACLPFVDAIAAAEVVEVEAIAPAPNGSAKAAPEPS